MWGIEVDELVRQTAGMSTAEIHQMATTPGTQVEFSVTMRGRPCWRCRLHLWWPPWRVHWQCRPAPELTYLEDR